MVCSTDPVSRSIKYTPPWLSPWWAERTTVLAITLGSRSIPSFAACLYGNVFYRTSQGCRARCTGRERSGYPPLARASGPRRAELGIDPLQDRAVISGHLLEESHDEGVAVLGGLLVERDVVL